MKLNYFLLLIAGLLLVAIIAGCKKESLPQELDKSKGYYSVDYDSSCPAGLQPLRVVGYSMYDDAAYWENDGHDWLVQSTVDTSKYWNFWGKQLTDRKDGSNKKGHSSHFYWPF